MRTLRALIVLCICLPGFAANASRDESSFIERKAFFEAKQVAQQFFLCLADAANADGDVAATAAAEACLRRVFDPDVVSDVNGNQIVGVDPLVALILGPLSDARTHTAITPSAFIVTEFDVGRSETTIGIATNVSVVQEIVAPGTMFGDVLGPQALVVRDTFRLRRQRGGRWRIVMDAARVLAVELRPDLLLLGPFPRFESPR